MAASPTIRVRVSRLVAREMVKHEVPAFMRDRESLTIRMMRTVHNDVVSLLLAHEHPGNLVLQDLLMQVHTQRGSDMVNRNRIIICFPDDPV